MRHCRIVDFLFRAVPLRPWQGFLIRRHIDRCPECGARLAGRDEARRALYRADDFGSCLDLAARVRAGLSASVRPARLSAWSRPLVRAAAAACALCLGAGISLLLLKGFRVQQPVVPLQAPERFAIDYVRVAGEAADSYLFQAPDQGMTLIWVEKKTEGGM